MCLIWVMISLVKAQIALKLFNDLALYTETYMNFTEMQIVFSIVSKESWKIWGLPVVHLLMNILSKIN